MNDYIVLDIDGKEYVETALIEKNGVTYSYLVNIKQADVFLIRKLVKDGDREYYERITDEDEYQLALMYLIKRQLHQED